MLECEVQIPKCLSGGQGVDQGQALEHGKYCTLLDAIDIPPAFPLDRAERTIDFGIVQIGDTEYLLPTAGYWLAAFAMRARVS